MSTERAATTTILFSDLVGSTELMQRAGDEDAQRIFKAHYQVLRDAVAMNGGAEVKSLGDGLMVAFSAAADAVRCAISMQQASRRSTHGERLAIRVGLNIGDALRDEGDYFGTSVVIARRLCDRSDAGQIVCSAAIAHVLAGRTAFSFKDLGPLTLKGIGDPVTACEAVYERDEPAAILARTPFVGRSAEVARLHAKFDETKAGRGGLVMLVGEPGIGKTRTAEEFAEWCSENGARVLRGRCYEGDWAPPFGPFAEALSSYARDADPIELREDLGLGAPPIARLVPSIRDRLPDIGEPASLQPDEERFRLLDAVSQFFITTSRRAPLLLILDDIHWADRGTIAMMRHVARFATNERLFVLGAYRDVELDRQHPLADALSALRREVEYERIVLKGLGAAEVGALLQAIAEQDVNPALVQAISDETDGNPFFIREVLAHLVEEGKLYREDGTWKSSASSIADLGIPEGVRQVITRRLARLSSDANTLLTAASAFSGGFSFSVVSNVAGLDEGKALDALDEALEAQVLRVAGDAEHYDFTHALIRHTLYAEMNPSRQVRLHRQIAQAMEGDAAALGNNQAGELAYQYHRSTAMPGAERGFAYAMLAADGAEVAGAWDEGVKFLRMALDLTPENDPARLEVRVRLSMDLIWSLALDDALETTLATAREITAAKGDAEAADFLATANRAFFGAGDARSAWELARAGVKLCGERRDRAWVILAMQDLQRQEAEDPDSLGIPSNSAERAAIVDTARRVLPANEFAPLMGFLLVPIVVSRQEILDAGSDADAMPLLFWAGEYRMALERLIAIATVAEREGRIGGAAIARACMSRIYAALGECEAAETELTHAQMLGGRLPPASTATLQVIAAEDDLREIRGEGYQEAMARFAGLAAQPEAQNNWAMAAIRAGVARSFAWLGAADPAMTLVGQAVGAIERAPGAAANYARAACNAAQVLWILERTDHAAIIERNLLEKLIVPDFRYPGVDARLALAQICALTQRHDEAVAWFERARSVLDEQGARPLRAIVDHDEALMYSRGGADGDAELALPLLDAALTQFRDIGMTGWARRAEELQRQLIQKKNGGS